MSTQGKILIIGASGLLGRYAALEADRENHGEIHLAAWRGQVPAIPNARLHRLDLREGAKARRWLEELRPTEVINCAGLVKSLCQNSGEAATLNSALPQLIARTIAQWSGRLVHVSTDCVFSGRRGFYSEKDPPDPIDLYGRAKLAGEVTEAPHLTIRTSFIGLEPAPAKGLLGWFLEQKGRVKGYRRAIWSGLTADALARILLGLAARREITGLLHVGGEAVNKADLLKLAARVFRKEDVIIEPVDEPVCDRSLDASKMHSLGIEAPPLRKMLEELTVKSGSTASTSA